MLKRARVDARMRLDAAVDAGNSARMATGGVIVGKAGVNARRRLLHVIMKMRRLSGGSRRLLREELRRRLRPRIGGKRERQRGVRLYPAAF